jgi:phosphonate transport system substrate-binding protein
MHLRTIATFGAALAVAASTAISATVFPVSDANAAEPVRFAVTDLVGMENLQREFGKFRDVLQKASGREIKFYPVSNRTAAVEALRSKKIDFVLTGPAEYVVFQKLTKAYPVVGFSRPDYFSNVIVMADSGITSVKQLKGRKIAVGDIGSTSNHLAPLQVIADLGLDPSKDLKIAHVSANIAWEALKRGDIAAIGMNNTKFHATRAKEKTLEPGAFMVIGRGRDLPNDVLLVGTHVDKATVDTFRTAFTDHSTELVKAILVGQDNQKYKGMKFLPKITDADYDYVRAMYATIGYPQFSNFVGD